MSESARNQARELPDSPGCYLMKNKEGTVIYVGKAKNLKRRVSSYFLPNRNAKTAALVEKIDTIDFVITGNEYEALILENNLISDPREQSDQEIQPSLQHPSKGWEKLPCHKNHEGEVPPYIQDKKSHKGWFSVFRAISRRDETRHLSQARGG